MKETRYMWIVTGMMVAALIFITALQSCMPPKETISSRLDKIESRLDKLESLQGDFQK